MLAGRWTYQIVEEYDDTYYAMFRGFMERARALNGGQRHAYEAALKEQRRTPGRPGNEATTAEAAQP